MSNDNYKKNEFFSRSINAAFSLAAFQPDGMQYTPPANVADDSVPAFLRDQMNRKKRNDPWGQNWHGGFPPTTSA
jgi:hypothetical protein